MIWGWDGAGNLTLDHYTNTSDQKNYIFYPEGNKQDLTIILKGANTITANYTSIAEEEYLDPIQSEKAMTITGDRDASLTVDTNLTSDQIRPVTLRSGLFLCL
jgi:hypothetical protein